MNMSEPNQLLSKEECEVVLSNYLNGAKTDWVQYKIEPVSDGFKGVSSEYYTLKLTYKCGNNEGNKRFFLKVINQASATISDFNASLNCYAKEEFFFNYLQVQFLTQNIDISFSPRGYFTKPNHIVMEDLSVRDFKMRDKNLLFDLKHSELALEALGKLHSASIILQNKKCVCLKEDFGEILEEKFFSPDFNLGSKWIHCSLDGILLLVGQLNLEEKVKTEAVEKIKTAFANFINILSNWKELTTVLHSDLWNNNFLFSYEESTPKEAVIVDYQLIKLGPPGLDFLELIFTNTRKDLRQNYYNNLLSTYYNSLSKNLSKHEIDIDNIFPRPKFLDSLKHLEVGARIHAIGGRSICFLNEESLKESLVNDEAMNNFFYEGRSRSMQKNFENNDLFREIIEEDILDLISSLS